MMICTHSEERICPVCGGKLAWNGSEYVHVSSFVVSGGETVYLNRYCTASFQKKV